MATTIIRDERVWACSDCVVLVANDDTSSLCTCGGEGVAHGDDCPALTLRVAVGHTVRATFPDVPSRYLRTAVVGPDEDDPDDEAGAYHDVFSSSACELCGSRLAGERFMVAVVASVPR